MRYFIWAAIGYLSGSVLYSYRIPLLLMHKDVTSKPIDHNPGAANVFMQAGVPLGIVCVLLDIAKGFVPVFLAAGRLDVANPAFVFVLVAPVLGHAFSAFHRMRGGKGIATSFGVLLGLLPGSLIVFLLAMIYIVLSILSLIWPDDHLKRSIIAYSLFAAVAIFVEPTPSIVIGCAFLSGIVIVKHVYAHHEELEASAKAAAAEAEAARAAQRAREMAQESKDSTESDGSIGRVDAVTDEASTVQSDVGDKPVTTA